MWMLLAIGAALSFGISDVAGAVVARRGGAGPAVLAIQLTGFPLLVAAAWMIGGVWSLEAIVLGLMVGTLGTAGFLLYIKSMAVGPIGVISPISAAVGAGVPVMWATLIGGETLGGLEVSGIVAGIVAVVLVAWTPGASMKAFGTAGPIIAFAAGVLFGLSFVVLDATPTDSGLLPLIAGRAIGTLGVAGFAIWSARATRPTKAAQPHAHKGPTSVTSSGPLAAPASSAVTTAARMVRRQLRTVMLGRTGMLAWVSGSGDSLAILLILLATRSGLLSLASLLTSLYPVVALIVARYFLHERLTRLQAGGVVTAMLAMAALTV